MNIAPVLFLLESSTPRRSSNRPKKTKSTAFIGTGEGQKQMMAHSVGMEYIPSQKIVRTGGDYGADPIGDGTFRMVPSGDIVDYEERMRRLPAKPLRGLR
jgi:hypothetical protein